MINIEELPSLKNIAEVILSEGGSGQLIIFCIPTEDVWTKWKSILLNALKNRLNERGENEFWDTLAADNNSSSPQKDIAEFLGFDINSDLNEILTSYGSESPLIIELLCGEKLERPWENFITNVARFFRVSDPYNTHRLICIFLISPSLYPPIRINAGIRCYGFWNPIRFEETRLLIAENFSEKENVMSLAWRISTYAGAANFDPDLINRLSRNSPRSLSDVRAEVLKCRVQANKLGNGSTIENRFFEEKRWDIPSGLIGKWLNGSLLGSTLDRGNIIPWQHISDHDFEKVFTRTIWREQVAGLYPLLMEITSFTSEIVSKVMGEKWKNYLDSGGNTESETEPGTILDTFKNNRLGFLPNKIQKLLKQLRIVRNRLAHLEPVDFSDVKQIWILFDKIS
jgi:hypothetical protein